MTEAAQLALIESIPKILAALGTLIVIALGALGALIVAIRQARKTAAVTDKKLDNIHSVTNQHLTDVTKKWEDSANETKDLKITVKGLYETIKALQETIKTLLDRENAAAPIRKDLVEKVTESGELSGHIADFIKELSNLAKDMKDTQAQVKTLLVARGEIGLGEQALEGEKEKHEN